MRFVTLLAALALLVATAATAGAQKKGKSFPDVIPLPNGWQPEGIASGNGNDLYVGSIPSGRVLKVNAKTGKTTQVVPQQEGRAAIGIKFDDGRLYVAGGPTGSAFVYDATNGATIANVKLTDATATFVNDVTLTDTAAYFTDSRQQQLYRLDRATNTATTLPITGDLQYDDNPSNNEANGIAATPDGTTLYVIQSNTGKLFTVDPQTGTSKLVAEGFPNGDGILLHGQTLYVVQNRLNKIAVLDLKTNTVTKTITDSDFDVPTTIARKGNSLYAVNARFGTPNPAAAEYDVVKVAAKKK